MRLCLKYPGTGRAIVLSALLLPASVRVSASPDAPQAGPAQSSTPATVFDSVQYRTFVPESLMAAKSVRRIAVATGWSATFRNTTDEIVTDLTITFATPVTLTFFSPFPEAVRLDEGTTWVVSGQSLAPGDQVTISGTGPRGGTSIRSWHYGTSAENPGFLPEDQRLLYAMPNSANVRAEVFGMGGFAPGASESDQLGGMVVGKSFLQYYNFRWRINPDSARTHGWVRIRKQRDLLRSLYYARFRLVHTGTPRGFCGYDNGRPFIRQATNLPPVKQNNRLFAHMAALKLNIASSQLGVTPPGLGELVYQEPDHPLNELMVRQISQLGDSMLTYCGAWPPETYLMIDSVVQKINDAFSGGIDTVSFGDSLVLTGVRPLSAVPFLRGNPLEAPLRIPRVYLDEYADDEEEEEESVQIVPEVIQVAQNYPNPFNPVTAIQFELQDFATVTVRIYDMLGRAVRTLMDREQLFDGTNEVTFDAGALASGVYVYRIVAEASDEPVRTSVFTGKMVLLR